MSHDQFPVFKLATLIARQLSAPIATRIKGYAKRHPVFSRVVCARTAEVFRSAEWRTRVLALRAAGRVGARAEGWTLRAPPPLSPAEAREVGGDILGEAVIFALGAAIVIFEVNRQAMNKGKQKEKERAAWAALLTLLEETRQQLEQQQRHIDRLRALLHAELERSGLAPHRPPHILPAPYAPPTTRSELSAPAHGTAEPAPTPAPEPPPSGERPTSQQWQGSGCDCPPPACD